MKQNVTIAYHADGKTELLHGPEVPFKDQQATVQRLRERGLPEGIVRVEIWPRKCVKFAHQPESEIRRVAAEEADRRARADALAAKLREDADRHHAENGGPK